MTLKDRLENARKHGYPIIHLFGNWYWERVYSKNYKKFSPWWFHHFKEPIIQIEETSIKPQGKYKLNE